MVGYVWPNVESDIIKHKLQSKWPYGIYPDLAKLIDNYIPVSELLDFEAVV